MEEKPAVAAPVNWEAVRMLALVVGVRESARRMGISEEAAMKRCQREGWLKSPEAKAVNQSNTRLKQSLNRASAICPQSVSPAAALALEIADLSGKSRVGFAKASAGVAALVATRDPQENLMDAQNVKAAAQTANMVFGWAEAAPQVRIRLDVLNGSTEAPIADAQEVETEVISDWPDGDPVEGY